MSYNDTEQSIDSGSPVELYEFVYQNQYIRLTTAATPQVYAAATYQPFPFKRGPFSTQATTVDQPLDLVAHKDFPPAQLFRVQAPSAVVELTVRRFHTIDGSGMFIVCWTGTALSADWSSPSEVTLHCESDLSAMNRLGLRRPWSYGCPYVLYGDGCDLLAADFAIFVDNFALTGRTLFVSAFSTYAPNYFAGGYIEYANPLTNITEVIDVASDASGTLQLSLTPYGLAEAGQFTVYPGCAHNPPDCTDKFDNYDNYGGQPDIPGINPFGGTELF